MKKISLQWRLTCIITVYIAVICGCLTMFVYKNGVYYIDSLQETVDAREDDNENDSDEYISAFLRISGMSSQMTFLCRCTVIRLTIKETVFIISAVLALMGG